MIRIKRFGQFIDSLNMQLTIKSYINIFKIGLIISLYLHSVTCFWVYVVDYDRYNSQPWFEQTGSKTEPVSWQWYPPLEDINYVDTVYFTQS